MIELKALQGQVRNLAEDLRSQVAAMPGLRAELRQEHEKAQKAERVAGTFESWLDDILDQAAVAWVLGCIFVRFCEDNGMVGEFWIGGPEPAAPAEKALERRQAYLVGNPLENDREWLREAFRYLRRMRATAKIFDGHNPVWRFDISGAAAERLSDFFRRGAGYESLRDPELKTRFLGDLYQELSAHAKKTYALLQTPEFVESFILDRTFEPAVSEFGLADTSVIDPTCGSGHFLLGAFHRLVDKWQHREPATPVGVLVERALGQVTGVDLNPFAVAIARFRLLVAAMKLCNLRRLEDTPAFPVRVATGDSLLPWGDIKSRAQGDLMALIEEKPMFAYESEDADLLKDYLAEGQYTVVVGNPPYITVADKARNKLYRSIYPTVCHRQYALTVPFAKRFFDLAKQADTDGDGAGFVGQITGNGFMKREFGKKLVEDYFADKIELTEVVDTSGAYIPGHGTPTVVLIGRSRKWRRSASLRAVLGIRGEPATPADPAQGMVWKSITSNIDAPGVENAYISVLDVPRANLSRHPWSLSGGGAAALMQQLSAVGSRRVASFVATIGRVTHTGSDDSYFAPSDTWRRYGLQPESVIDLVAGDVVRDWLIAPEVEAMFPYDSNLEPSLRDEALHRMLWLTCAVLEERREPGGTHAEIGLTWYEWSRWHPERFSVPLGIGMAFVATHNHFVLDRGGKVFKQSAPVIKLPAGATEDDHLKLLGVLNSSAACFWLKQVSHAKTGADNSSGGGNRWSPEPWFSFYEFTGTKLQEFPLPGAYPLERARKLDELAQRLASVTPAAVAASGVPTAARLAEAERKYHAIRGRMIALQEELDWEVYRLYGLIDEDLTCADPPELELGERAFEIVLAASGADTEWFNRHGSKPISSPPAHWPADYRKLVERRIDAMSANLHIKLVERPEYKRRWNSKPWAEMQKAALESWLLDRLESPELWGGMPTPLSVAEIADRLRGDEEFRAALGLWVGHDDYDLPKTLNALVAEEHVPYLPAQRYKPSGLRKRAQWERTWALQRREDAGEKVTIEVPPKYTSADFARPSYWKARGKLDVPKERFVSYPDAKQDGDVTELIGWAGWDHLEQAQALAGVYMERKNQTGWPAHRLLPLLAGLVEIEPWLHQWHTDKQPGYMTSPADFYTTFIDGELAQLSSDRAALALLRGVPELS
ncbi:SAM-dependent methyltransferase [Micromonospora echinospora]|uniref:site-specific DNA-methyltransferase (adenine-specific) n=1 Tax=Micromonospora echinospora TaxID=1877 RepID=A0A1C4V5Q8_MICEC|nr:BREX-2 system adenine-specific DNA-methyltransferase PglX [Micromonospora echinospora]OZV83108.1 SAM-dependent methyltransferase [Micromonospora echinospora]SCE79350.1 Methyltransferase domain-containing protein [Micromonospora echinospora]